MRKKISLPILITVIFLFENSLISASEGDPLSPPVNNVKYVFAHYMTWFGRPEKSENWYNWAWPQKPNNRNPERMFRNGRRDVASLHYPLIGPYDSTDEDVLEYHILSAKSAGIDGFVVNWYNFSDKGGSSRHIDEGFRNLLRVSENLGFKVCIDVDDKCMFPPYTGAATRQDAVEEAKKALRRIFREYARSEAYFRIDGKPVITNFGWGPPSYSNDKAVSFSPQEWKEILDSVREFKPLFIADHQWHWEKSIKGAGFLQVADSIYPWVSGGPVPRIKFYEQSKQAVAEGKMKFISGEACPGFDSYGTWGWGGGRTIISREGGKVYRQTWDECLKYGAKWIQIITWNDFAEGTTIEPTLDYGYEYLEITSDYTAKIKKIKPDYDALRIPKDIYDIKSRIKRLKEEEGADNDVLSLSRIDADKAAILVACGYYDEARSLIRQLNPKLKKIEAKTLPKKELKISMLPEQAFVFTGESQQFEIDIKNQSSEDVKGLLKIDTDGDIPKSWISIGTTDIEIKAGKESKIPFEIKVPQNAEKKKTMAEARLNLNGKMIRSPVALIEVAPSYFNVDIGPRHILRPKQAEKVSVRIMAQQKNPDSGKVTLKVPDGWKVSPREASYTMKNIDDVKVDFLVTPGEAKEAAIAALITSKTRGEVSVSEPFVTLNDGEVTLLEGDINGDGFIDFVLGNDKLEIQISSALGGRILAFYLRQTGNNQLFLDYPAAGKVPESKEWVEYGGINDTFPKDWPGELWNNTWDYQALTESANEKALIMSSKTKDGLLLKRKMILSAGSNALNVDYTVTNLGNSQTSFAWSNHPDLALGPQEKAQSRHDIVVPGESGVIKETFRAIKDKKYYVPGKGWCVALDTKTGEYFAQRFEKTLVKNIGVWEGEDFFTMEVMLNEISLAPGEKIDFNITYITGKDDWERE